MERAVLILIPNEPPMLCPFLPAATYTEISCNGYPGFRGRLQAFYQIRLTEYVR